MRDSYCMPEDYEWEPPPRMGRHPSAPDPELCCHCQLEPKSRKHQGTNLGAWCMKIRREGGELPTPEQLERRQLKLYRDQQEEEGHDPSSRYETVVEIPLPPAGVSYYAERTDRPRRTGPTIPDVWPRDLHDDPWTR